MKPYRYAIDAFAVVWVAAMLALGVLAMTAIDRVANAADSLTQIASEERDLATALAPLESLPLAGSQVAAADQELRDASRRTAGDAEITGASIHQLARIAFGVVALLALFPLVTFYLPLRVRRSQLVGAMEHGRPQAT